MSSGLGEPLKAPMAWPRVVVPAKVQDAEQHEPAKKKPWGSKVLHGITATVKMATLARPKGVKRFQKEGDDKPAAWRTFRQVSVSGIDATMDRKSPLLRRALWAFMLVICASLMLAQCLDRIITYAQENVNVNVRVKRNVTLEFPAITICNRNPFNRTAALEIAVKHGLLPANANEDKVNVSQLVGVEGMTVTDLWERLAHRRELYVQDCWYKRNILCEEVGYWKKVHTVLGPCHTFTLYKSSINTVGSFASLYMRLQDLTPPGPKSETGVFILLHHFQASPVLTMRTHSLSAELGWARDIKIELRKFQTLDTASSPCMRNANYSQDRCNLECFQYGLNEYSKCRMPFMIKEPGGKECISASEYEAGMNSVTEMLQTSGWTVADCDCTNECTKTTFQAYPNNMAYLTNQTRLRFFYSDLVYEDITEDWAYSTISLLCDIGGTLGLLMGASVLTVCELLEVGWSYFLQRCCRLEPPATPSVPPDDCTIDPDMQKALSKLRVPEISDDLWGEPVTPSYKPRKVSLTFRNLKLSKMPTEHDKWQYKS